MPAAYIKCALVVAIACGLIGCGAKQSGAEGSESRTLPPPPPVVAPAPNAPGSPPIASAPAPTSIQVVPGVVVAGPPNTSAGRARPLDENGAPLSDLELLNQLVMAYMDPAAGPGAGDIDPPPRPPLKDIQDLVKGGLIPVIPEAPAGKKYILDPKTSKVLLADK